MILYPNGAFFIPTDLRAGSTYRIFVRTHPRGVWTVMTVPEINRRWWDWSNAQQGVMWEVVASTEDPDEDEDFKRLEKITDAAPSPRIPRDLGVGWMGLDELSLNTARRVGQRYLSMIRYMSPAVTKERMDASNVLRFLSVPGITNHAARLYVRLIQEGIRYRIPEEVSARLATHNITLDCAIELGCALVDERLSEKEVFEDIITVMEHVASGGEPVQELQEVFIP